MIKFNCSKVCVLFFVSLNYALSKPVVVCYYPTYTTRPPPEDIDLNICTHINYAFAGLNSDGTLRIDGSDSLLYRLSALKQKNKDTKVLLSVGSWSAGKNFSMTAASQSSINNLARTSLEVLEKYDLDGIDIDWEFPTTNGGTPSDKENFVTMCKTLKEQFQQNDYLLTAALWSQPEKSAFDIPEMSRYLDLMNIMLYDFHQPSQKKTGQNAPLYPEDSETAYQKSHLNCNASITGWLDGGADPAKVTFGLGFYGQAYKLADPAKHGVNAPAVGAGNIIRTYGNICQLNWTKVWDDEQKVPYKYHDDQWVGYDDPESIKLKVEYAQSKNLVGMMVWTIAQDDLDGKCGQKNGLLNAIKESWK